MDDYLNSFLVGVLISKDISPDFITFFCHHIAYADFQRIRYDYWVALGGAS